MSTTHDEQVARYTEPYRGPATADPDPSEEQNTEAASDPTQNSEMAELLVLLKAHLDFCAKALTFTNSAVDEIRRNLAGTD